MTSCSFAGEQCNSSDFHWLWIYYYGNCWQFNSGINLANQKVNIKETNNGIDSGLEVSFNILENKNIHSLFHSEGLIVFVTNHSHLPYVSDPYVFVKGGEKTFISVKRMFNSKYPYPYSECVDLTSYSSDIHDLISSNRTYRQSDCFKLCRQKLYIENCGCNLYFDYLNINPNARYCENSTDYFCHLNVFYKYSRQECVRTSCPLECDSVHYDLSVTSLAYPSLQLYESQNDELKRNQTYESFKASLIQFNVFYPSLEYTIIKESPKLTALDLFGQIGGTLNIFVSLSIFTLFEMLEVVVLVLHALIFKKK